MTTASANLLAIANASNSLSSAAADSFVDRRVIDEKSAGFERRQFGNSHATLSPDARELAEAIDSYKVQHRRRYITFEEMLRVIHSLGYQKQ